MTEQKPKFGSLRANRRSSAIKVSQESLIKAKQLDPNKLLPLVITPAVEGVDLTAWALNNLILLEKYLLKHGGILFRGFDINSLEAFQKLMSVFSEDLLDYTYGFTPRSQLSDKIYTSTEYPPDQIIPAHNEKSYDTSWPMKISLCCLTAPEKGGETPIYDSNRVLQRIDPAVRERFAAKNVMYMRNYSERLDLPWQNVFGTSDKAEVEAFCHQAGIDYVWKADGHLQTRQVCQAIATHPLTGAELWFNQAHLFHVTSLPKPLREALLAEFDEDDLPRQAYYGDGTSIESEVLDQIRQAYDAEAIIFPWQEGDVVLLDNMLAAHGRNPFVGPRKIVVAMAQPFGSQGISTNTQ
jgi:alpha-ketoglutarate-dependent taurine dioxygenase